MRTFTRICLVPAIIFLTASVAAPCQFIRPNQNPASPGIAQPDVFPRNDSDPSFQQIMRNRRDRLVQDRFDRLKLGSDHLRDLCAQLQSNLALHATPDEADRKLMADIERQAKALHNLMVQ